MAPNAFYRHDEVYTSSIATPELVGRDQEIEQIRKLIKDFNESYIVYITGTGGIGKTVLMNQILSHLPGRSKVAATKPLIDLYHANQRTPEGFEKAIQESLSPSGRSFTNYLREYTELQNDIIHFPEKVTEQRENVRQAFIDDLRLFSQKKRIVIALDTAERLFYENDPVEIKLGISEEFSGFLRWLVKEFLLAINNVVILIAGRPGPDAFQQSLTSTGKQVETINLSGLTEEAAVAYFDAVANRAKLRGRPEDQAVANAILTFFTEEYRRVIFWTLCETEPSADEPRVRPLLLSLALDYAVSNGHLFDALTQPLASARKLSDPDRRRIEQQLALEIGTAVRQIPHSVVNEILRALAYTRKGADTELIAKIIDSAEINQEKIEETLQQSQLRNFAFIKTRVDDRRLFLHDEMYDLLRRYTSATPAGQYSIPTSIHEAISAYYKDHIDSYREKIGYLYRAMVQGDSAQAHELPAQIELLNNAILEDLYYQLRYDINLGFETYYRCAEEALIAKDDNLDQQLRAELLSTLVDERRYAEKQADKGRITEIDDFLEHTVYPDGAVRWVKRFTLLQNHPGKALAIAESLHANAAGLIAQGDELIKVCLADIEGHSHALQGDLETASRLLNVELIKQIENIEVSENKVIRSSAVLARACNDLGYLSRVEGKYIKAEFYYWKAIPFWRYLRMGAQQANTMNNRAFVLALTGQFIAARLQVNDALVLREQLGQPEPVVLSLNTRAEIEIYAGNYREAQVPAEKALDLAVKNRLVRGEGLACLSMAILSRFRSEPDQSVTDIKRREYMDRALKYSSRAYDIFSKENPEPERWIRALLEQGLALRERYRLSLANGSGDEATFEKAEAAVCAAQEACREQKYWLLSLDAYLSECWLLYYHPQKRTLLPGMLKKLNDDFDAHYPEYRISMSGYPPKDSETVISVFSQLARMHNLAGILAIDAYHDKGKQLPSDDLKIAGQQFALTFAYDEMIARDYLDTIRAEKIIYERIKKYNPFELRTIFEGILDAPGKVLPADADPKKLLFWVLLEKHFGPYDVMKRFKG